MSCLGYDQTSILNVLVGRLVLEPWVTTALPISTGSALTGMILKISEMASHGQLLRCCKMCMGDSNHFSARLGHLPPNFINKKFRFHELSKNKLSLLVVD